MDDPLRELLAKEDVKSFLVLILIVMDDPLREDLNHFVAAYECVLILIVMDDPLRAPPANDDDLPFCLNPYCNG